MSVNKIKATIIVAMLACMLIPAFRPTTAFKNAKAYKVVHSNVTDLNESLSTIDDDIESYRKEINEIRGEAVDAENPNALYEKIKTLPGVKSLEASSLAINGDTIKIKGEFNPSGENTNIDGIQMIITVENVSNFITELSKLNLTYETMNVIYAENKIIINLGTKGGV